MLDIVLVGKDLVPFKQFISVLEGFEDIKLRQLHRGEELFQLLESTKADVVLFAEVLEDGQGLSFAEALMKKHPLINCALASDLPADEFHEATEGLGIFMQLPVRPKGGDAGKMMQLLGTINALLNH